MAKRNVSQFVDDLFTPARANIAALTAKDAATYTAIGGYLYHVVLPIGVAAKVAEILADHFVDNRQRFAQIFLLNHFFFPHVGQRGGFATNLTKRLSPTFTYGIDPACSQ